MTILKSYSMVVLFLLMQLPGISQQKEKYKRHFFNDAGLGYARAEDGIPTVKASELKQMSTSFRVAAGYGFSKYLSASINYLYTARLNATGVLLANNKSIELVPSFSTFSLTATGILPIGRSSIEFSAGPALLLQNLQRKEQGVPEQTINTSNTGFNIAAGYRYAFSQKISLQARFDFMDPYGDKANWEGDLGILNVCVRYSFR